MKTESTVHPSPSGRRSLGLLVTGTGLAQVIQFAASLVLTRLYTPEEFGQYASILAVATLLGAAITFSYPTAIAMAQDDEESRIVAWLSVGLAAMSAASVSIVLSALVVAGAEFWGWRPDWRHVFFIPLTSLSIAVWSTLQLRQARLSGFRRVAVATSGGAVTQASTQIALGWSGAGAVGLSSGYLVGRLVNTAVLARGSRLGRPPGWNRLRGAASRWSEMPRWLLLVTIMNMLGTSAITPWVAHNYGLVTAGSFAFALQMLSVPAALVGQAIGTILFPRFAEAERGSGISPALLDRYTRGLAAFAFPLFLPVIALGPELFSLVFGPDWAGAGQIAAILSPYLAVNLVTSPISSIAVVKRRMNTILRVATLDTTARFTAIALGATANSSWVGFVLYSTVGVMVVTGYLAWLLRLSGVRLSTLVLSARRPLALAATCTVVLLWGKWNLPLDVRVAITGTVCAICTFTAIRGIRR